MNIRNLFICTLLLFNTTLSFAESGRLKLDISQDTQPGTCMDNWSAETGVRKTYESELGFAQIETYTMSLHSDHPVSPAADMRAVTIASYKSEDADPMMITEVLVQNPGPELSCTIYTVGDQMAAKFEVNRQTGEISLDGQFFTCPPPDHTGGYGQGSVKFAHGKLKVVHFKGSYSCSDNN